MPWIRRFDSWGGGVSRTGETISPRHPEAGKKFQVAARRNKGYILPHTGLNRLAPEESPLLKAVAAIEPRLIEASTRLIMPATERMTAWQRKDTPTTPRPLFPRLGDAELRQLAADIKANGLLNPVVRHRGKILDGRNRLAACEIAGVKPKFVEWQGTGSPAVVGDF